MLRLLLALLLLPVAAQAQPTLLVNATIYTVDSSTPMAEAMAFEHGRILAVGSQSDLRAAYPGATVLDAGGRTVVPGLIDAHAHLMNLGGALLSADLVGATSRADVIARLQAFAADLPEGAWLTGRGWDQNDWPNTDFPTASDLDAAFPDRPVWLQRIDGHAGWANSAAMRMAGIDPDAMAPADPEGGSVLKDAQGRPTGVFIDNAEGLVGRAVPSPSMDEQTLMLGRALQETARYGLTGVHEAGIGIGTIRLYQNAIDDGRFPLRLYAMIGGEGLTMDHFCDQGLMPDYKGRLAVRSLKLYMDGALGSRGAAMIEPYTDDPTNHGLLLTSPDRYADIVARAMACGLQVNTHAIGDRANRIVLDTYAQMIPQATSNAGRHRIEHAQVVVSPEDIARFAPLGIIASMQPTHATSDMPWAEDRVGSERIQGAYAWRSFLDSGARLALGSDFPVERVDPLLGFYSSVTRQDADQMPEGGWYPGQLLTRAEALRGFTLDAAYAGFMEDEVGSLTPGKRADFVVLSRDIMTVPTDQILDAEVVATFLDGAAIYGRL